MRSQAITTYSPEAEIRRPGVLLRNMLRDVRNSFHLAWRLARRDIAAQYRQSYLGYLWAFIMPLANTVVWIMLNGSGVVRVADTGIPYPVFVFTGTMIWQVLVESVQSPLQQVAAARSFLTKLKFPREALIVSGMIKQVLGVGIKLVILVPVVLLLGVTPDWHVLLVPLALLATMVTGMALGLVISPIGMLYSDVGRVVPLFAQFLMYVTPVVFSMPASGRVAELIALNPATPLVLTGRAWLTGAETPVLVPFLLVTAAALVLLCIGAVLFRVALPILIERLST